MSGLRLETISSEEAIQRLLAGVPTLDVRSPGEFADGSLPGSVNLPILNNEERAQVGITYKQQGREHAIEFGTGLVSGDVKAERVRGWSEFVQAHPEAVIYCFRGGLRSKYAQMWLAEAGWSRPRIDGGFKKVRAELTEHLRTWAGRSEICLLTGPTGAGKSLLLPRLQSVVDLEGIAQHRGSAFGGMGRPQPSQVDFETRLAVACLRRACGRVWFEDESRSIGSCVIPDFFFDALRASPVVYLDEPMAVRIANIRAEYVERPLHDGFAAFEHLLASTQKISKKLGGLRAEEILRGIETSRAEFEAGRGLESCDVWIRQLLEWYYDPYYLRSFEKRQLRILFRGSHSEILSWAAGPSATSKMCSLKG